MRGLNQLVERTMPPEEQEAQRTMRGLNQLVERTMPPEEQEAQRTGYERSKPVSGANNATREATGTKHRSREVEI